MNVPVCVICRQRICHDHKSCAAELLALCERVAERTERERAA